VSVISRRPKPVQSPTARPLPPAGGEPSRTVGALLADVVAVLPERRQARLVVAAALGIEPSEVMGFPERAISREGHQRALEFARRRAAGEPVSRLAGRREFWSLSFALSPETLDPRPDSETLVEAALALLPDRTVPLRILDLGTGTGCLLLALLAELEQARGVGVDLAEGAARTAMRNAQALGLADRASFMVGDWGAALHGRFDLVVSNPPYIASAAIGDLEPAVAQHDPVLALDGGLDGLAAYRALAGALPGLLGEGRHAVLELGEGQAAAVRRVMEETRLTIVGTSRDLAGIERCLVVRQKTVGMDLATV
jgi:release factor glutamine methyltransferase